MICRRGLYSASQLSSYDVIINNTGTTHMYNTITGRCTMGIRVFLEAICRVGRNASIRTNRPKTDIASRTNRCHKALHTMKGSIPARRLSQLSSYGTTSNGQHTTDYKIRMFSSAEVLKVLHYDTTELRRAPSFYDASVNRTSFWCAGRCVLP